MLNFLIKILDPVAEKLLPLSYLDEVQETKGYFTVQDIRRLPYTNVAKTCLIFIFKRSPNINYYYTDLVSQKDYEFLHDLPVESAYELRFKVRS